MVGENATSEFTGCLESAEQHFGRRKSVFEKEEMLYSAFGFLCQRQRALL